MAGKIKQMIDVIIDKRTNGNQTLVGLTKAKIIMKGVFPDRYDINSEDDPVVIEKLKVLMKELNIEY